jgi:hypothetical protein
VTSIPGIDPIDAIGDAAFQGPQQQSQDPLDLLGDVIADDAAAKAQEARGFTEHVGNHLGNAAKAFGDGTTLLFASAFKGGGALASGVSGQGFGNGWESNARLLEHQFGSRDPSIVDLYGAATGDIRQDGLSLGQRADRHIQQRLGNAAIASQTVGHLLSFATGPGAALGRGAARVAAPMAGAAERAMAKAVSRGVPGADLALRNGDVWRFLTQSPEWQRTASILERTLAQAGPTVGAFARGKGPDLVGATAANIAQSWAMTPDAEKSNATIAAAFLSPFLIPIARAGERLGGSVMRLGMGEEQAKRLHAAYGKLERGEIGLQQLDDELRIAVPTISRIAGGAVVAPAVEGSAFLMLDPGARDELQKYLAGDSDAGARLLASWLGTAAGISAIKHSIPHNLIPFFKGVQPDANSLSTFIEAEANRRALTEKPPEDQGLDGITPEQLAEIKARNAQAPPADEVGAQARVPGREPTEAEVSAQWRAEVAAREVRNNYGWAEGPTLGLLRGGWEPDLVPGTQDVGLTFGRDHRVVLGREEGGVVLRFDPAIEGVLAENGIPVATEGRTVTSPTSVEYRGPAAKKALDDLAMLSLGQSLRGDLTFQRLGFREVMPGVWADPDGTLYTTQIDGSTVSKKPTESAWNERHEFDAAGFPEGPGWTNETTERLKEWLLIKWAQSPDPAVDSLMLQAVAIAHNGNSFGAEQIRAFLESVPFEALSEKLNPADYRMLALQLGSLARGHSNPAHASMELSRDAAASRLSNAPSQDALFKSASVPGPGEPRAPTAEEVAARNARAPSQDESFAAARVPESGDVAHAVVSAAEAGDPASQQEIARRAKPETRSPMETEIPSAQEPEVSRMRALQEAAAAGDEVSAREIVRLQGETLGERLLRMKDDPPDVAYTGAMGGNVARDLLQAGKRPLRETYDYMFETQAEAITRRVPGESLGYEARRALAKRAEVIGKAKESVRPAESAMRSKEGKRLLKGWSQVDGLEPGEGQVPHWVALADKRVKPSSDVERGVQEGFQAFNRDLWDAAVEVGEVRTEQTPEGPKTMPLRKRQTSTMQRVIGSDAADVMADPALRMKWWDTLLRANPDTKVHVKQRGEQPATPELLEAEWLDSQVAKKVEGFDREAATEFLRRFKNVPYDWKPAGTKKAMRMFESDPFKVIEAAAERQSARVSAVEQWGQEVPEATRQAMLADPSLPVSARRNLERGGISKRMERFERDLAKAPNLADKETTRKAAQDLVARVQSTEPVQRQWYAKGAFKAFHSLRASFLAAKGFIYDIPEMGFRNWTYAGTARTVKAIAAVARNPAEAIRYAERTGAIERAIGDWVIDEAHTLSQKAADVAGYLANLSERTKGAIATRVADAMLVDMRAGKATVSDLQFAQDLLRLPAEDMLAIRRGDISDALARQFRRETVGFLTSRVRPGEGSRFAASPNMAALFTFTRWITKRTSDTVRTVASVKRAIDQHGAYSKEAAAAWWRLTKLGAGMTLSGVAGQMLGQLVSGAFAGEPYDEGMKKYLDRLSYSPLQAVGDALRNQVIGGPFSQAMRAAEDPESGRAWAGVTAPSAVAHAFLTSLRDYATKGDIAALWSGLGNAGLVPFRRDLETTAAAVLPAWFGDPEVRSDSRAVGDWQRLNDIKRPFGERNKPAEFYDAISGVLGRLRESEGDAEKAVSLAASDIQKALSLAPEESVAAAIEGHQHVRHLTSEQRADLAEYVNNDQRMQRIYQHDELLRRVAKVVRRMEGTNPSEWEQEVDSVAAQARLGASDRWRGLVDRAVDDSTQRLLAGEGLGSQIDEVAASLAQFPAHLGSVFSEDDTRRLADPRIDSVSRARRIAANLRKRAYGRRAEETRRLNIEKNRR